MKGLRGTILCLASAKCSGLALEWLFVRVRTPVGSMDRLWEQLPYFQLDMCPRQPWFISFLALPFVTKRKFETKHSFLWYPKSGNCFVTLPLNFRLWLLWKKQDRNLSLMSVYCWLLSWQQFWDTSWGTVTSLKFEAKSDNFCEHEERARARMGYMNTLCGLFTLWESIVAHYIWTLLDYWMLALYVLYFASGSKMFWASPKRTILLGSEHILAQRRKCRKQFSLSWECVTGWLDFFAL